VILEKGNRIPNWEIKEESGETHALWDYRQKSHLVLLFEPAATAETRQRWRAAVQADQKQWDWLNTKVFIVQQAPPEMAPGAYVIDRYGMFWNYFSPDHWSFDDLERDLVYYEARHC
jgi:hypothetical protein